MGRLGNTGNVGFKDIGRSCQEDRKEPLALRGEAFKSVELVTTFPDNKYSGSHRDIIAARLNKIFVP